MIVGLTGKKGSGKDTVADYLVKERGFTRVAFADPLKESAAALLGCTTDDLERWKNNPYMLVSVGCCVEDGWLVGGHTQTVRSFLQRYGTESHRDVFGKDFWVDLGADAILTAGPNVVVTDVRFDNEAAAIRSLGGEIVKVFRPSAELADDSHASEQLPDSDYDLVNDGSFEYLYAQLEDYLAEHVARSA